MLAERIGNVAAAIEELEVVEASTGVVRERTNRKAGVHAPNLACKAPHERAREKGLEGFGHAASAGILAHSSQLVKLPI